MKTTFKTLICALALSTTVAFAGTDSNAAKPSSFKTGIYKTKDGNLTVNIEKKTTAAAIVVIRNFRGNILAQESLAKKQTKGAIRFDLSALEDGEYTLSIASKGEKEIKNFVITSENTVTSRTLSFE